MSGDEQSKSDSRNPGSEVQGSGDAPPPNDPSPQGSESPASPGRPAAPTETPSLAATSDTADQDTQDAWEAENLIESYQIIGEWIRFADAKAAAVLAVNGALAGVLIPTLRDYLQSEQPHPTAWWTGLVSVIFVIWLASLILSCGFAFCCILPFRRRGAHPAIGQANHFHPAAISHAYDITAGEQFVRECERLGMAGLKREICICMLVDAHVSNAKYRWVTISIRMVALNAILGLLYLLAIQF